MKQEQVIELAKLAGATQWCPGWHLSTDEVAKLVQLVEQATLERAAQACEQSEAYRGSVFAARIRALKDGTCE